MQYLYIGLAYTFWLQLKNNCWWLKHTWLQTIKMLPAHTRRDKLTQKDPRLWVQPDWQDSSCVCCVVCVSHKACHLDWADKTLTMCHRLEQFSKEWWCHLHEVWWCGTSSLLWPEAWTSFPAQICHCLHLDSPACLHPPEIRWHFFQQCPTNPEVSQTVTLFKWCNVIVMTAKLNYNGRVFTLLTHVQHHYWQWQRSSGLWLRWRVNLLTHLRHCTLALSCLSILCSGLTAFASAGTWYG